MTPKDDIFDSTLYVATTNKKGEVVFLGNKFIDGQIEAKTNVLGHFFIARDSISPTITPKNFRNNSSVAENWSLRLEIDDKDSGINEYDMYINGEWVLADYDAKNKLLMYQIDDHISKGNNTLEVFVTDMVGNRGVYRTIIQR